jgi:hypothetical protein
VALLLLYGCSTKYSDTQKLDFLKQNFFYNISYEEFMQTTPNLTNIHDHSIIIDATSGHASNIGTWSFIYNDFHFLLQGLTPGQTVSDIYCSTPSKNNYLKTIKFISKYLGEASFTNTGTFPSYKWKVNTTNVSLYIPHIDNQSDTLVIGIH